MNLFGIKGLIAKLRISQNVLDRAAPFRQAVLKTCRAGLNSFFNGSIPSVPGMQNPPIYHRLSFKSFYCKEAIVCLDAHYSERQGVMG